MSEPSLVRELRTRSDEDSTEFVNCFDRLNALTQTRFERPLCAQEFQELCTLRSELRNRLAGWLEKR